MYVCLVFQWGSTLKVSIELPATDTRHCHDMTERLLKMTWNPPKKTNKIYCIPRSNHCLATNDAVYFRHFDINWDKISLLICWFSITPKICSIFALKYYWTYSKPACMFNTLILCTREVFTDTDQEELIIRKSHEKWVSKIYDVGF